MKILIAACAAAFVYGLTSQAWAQNDIPEKLSPMVTLEAALVRALEAAPAIKARQEAMKASEGTLEQAGIRPMPSFSLEAENILGTGVFNGFNQTETTFSLDQKIERGGKRGARIGLAQSERHMTRLSAMITRQNIIFEVRKAYIDAMTSAAVLKNARSRAETTQKLVEVVNLRIRSARDSSAAGERLTARIMAENADVAQAEYALNNAKRRLSALWGDGSYDFTIDKKSFYDARYQAKPAQLNHRVSAPELRLAEAAEDNASAALILEQANSKLDPTVRLGVRQFQQSGDVAAVMSFSMPFSFSNSNRGNIARAAAQRRRSAWLVRDAKMQFDRDYNSNLETLHAARAEIDAFRNEIIPQAKFALDKTRTGYGRGAFIYLDVMAAQRALQEYMGREILALRRFHLAAAALDRLSAAYEDPLSVEGNIQ
ncbi:MAG: TolC family protein [Emcibacter sp.]|nr:TolC family protein [Emcibacter sp.]